MSFPSHTEKSMGLHKTGYPLPPISCYHIGYVFVIIIFCFCGTVLCVRDSEELLRILDGRHRRGTQTSQENLECIRRKSKRYDQLLNKV